MKRRRNRSALGQHDAHGGPYRLTGDELELAVERAATSFFGMYVDPANADVYDPRETQLVPKDGGWAMITRQLPPIEGRIDEHVRVGRVFYVEHQTNADDEGFMPSGEYKVKADTPWGTVHLWPYEYAVKDPATILKLWQDGALTFHPTNTSPAQFNDIVFYARSRCISLADAMVMALGTIKGPVGWFEPATPELATSLEEMAYRIHAPLTAPFHRKRRAAARKRMQEAAK